MADECDHGTTAEGKFCSECGKKVPSKQDRLADVVSEVLEKRFGFKRKDVKDKKKEDDILP